MVKLMPIILHLCIVACKNISEMESSNVQQQQQQQQQQPLLQR